ncbi:MAG: TonB-dependent receptor [Gemmatimonadaceae bacterium]|nr:TonB-dependent receptor [Gemmatimonadaceae bacterium]
MRLWWFLAGALALAAPLAVARAQSTAVTPPPTEPGPPRAAPRALQALERPVTLSLSNVSLGVALRTIIHQAHLDLAFSDRAVPVDRRVSISVNGVAAGEALKRVLDGTGLVVRESPSGQLTLVKEEVQRRSAVGADTVGRAGVMVHVVDSATAKALPGAVLGVRGTRLVATTNEQGYALLRDVPAGVRVVTVRYLGYAPAEQPVTVPDSGYVRVDFALRMGMTRLQDVVTTATGPRRRYELANDVTILNVDSLVATQPISSVTDLLEGRVPGLVVQHTSGAPGDPSRLRLRGASSVLRSNDPIVIVDGIRTYAAQSDSQSANLAAGSKTGNVMFGGGGIAAPSPLDQIDPQSIATIEVMKGPSAATLYGPDAANGVIVITTKKGRAGPARWSASASRGTSYLPGRYPMGFYRWGHDYYGNLQLCALVERDCQADSLVQFQALNDPRYSPLAHGRNTSVSVAVSGGTDALTYSLTGSYQDETGILSLPDVEAARFATQHGGATPPEWMRRPQQNTVWSGASRLGAKLGAKADASISTMITRQKQQRSTLERQLTPLMTTYVDPATGTYWRGDGARFSPVNDLLPDFYQRATDDATNVINGANVTWRPLGWLTASADAGINVISRQDEVLLPRGMVFTPDSIGKLNIAHGTTVVSTVNLRATATVPLPLGFHLQLATGANYTKTSLSSLASGVSGLAPGTSSLNGAEQVTPSTQTASDVTSFGWYVEPSFTHKRFTISTGLRLDGSSTFGANVHLPAFPKLGVSWLLSEEPFFPFKNIFDVFRVRAAYGRAGVWPGPADRLRLFATSRPWVDGSAQDALQVSRLGNSQLKPERSTEIEGGFDADMFGDRLSIDFSAYRKTRYDAIMSVPVAPSVYGNDDGGVYILRNIGVIRNAGLELSVTTQLMRSDPFTWSTTLHLSRNHNLVTKLGAGVLPFGQPDARVAAGYPLFGRWAKPILAYADVNGDGIIDPSEVQLGDTLVYMGPSEPKYEAGAATSFSLFRGALSVSADFTYQDGLTQFNEAIGNRNYAFFSPAASDPSAPLAQQAAVAVAAKTDYGLLQTVNLLRFNSLSVTYNAPPRIAQRFGASALSVAVQGRNVGLWTNYAGKDPNVNAFATGNSVMDTGVLPMPRTWLLSVRATY